MDQVPNLRGRDVALGRMMLRKGEWKLSCWRTFAQICPKSISEEPAESCTPIFPAAGGPVLPWGCAPRASAEPGIPGDMAMPAVAAGA